MPPRDPPLLARDPPRDEPLLARELPRLLSPRALAERSSPPELREPPTAPSRPPPREALRLASLPPLERAASDREGDATSRLRAAPELRPCERS